MYFFLIFQLEMITIFVCHVIVYHYSMNKYIFQFELIFFFLCSIFFKPIFLFEKLLLFSGFEALKGALVKICGIIIMNSEELFLYAHIFLNIGASRKFCGFLFNQERH